MQQLEVGIGKTWFGIRINLFAMGDGDMVESNV